MKATGLLLMLVGYLMSGPVWADRPPVSMALGAGFDASTYAGEGLFDVGPVVSGYVAWTGSYPRVYRLNAQWTRLHHDPNCGSPDAGMSGWSSCDTDILNLAAFQLSVLWFGGNGGRGELYGGVGSGVHTMTEGHDRRQWSPIFSMVFGRRFRVSGLCISLEGGGELIIGGDTGFAVIPVRMFFEF